MTSETSIGVNSNTTARPISMRFVFQLCPSMKRLRTRRKTSTFIHNTHSVPPSAPVHAYHCTSEGVFAKTLPSVSHGHDNSQLKCRNSNAIQAQSRTEVVQCGPIAFLIRWNRKNASAIRRLLQKNAI